MPVRKLEARSEVPLEWRNVGWSQHETRASREEVVAKTPHGSGVSSCSKAKYLNKSEPMLLPLEAVKLLHLEAIFPRDLCALGITATKAPQTHQGAAAQGTQLCCRGTACYWKCGLKSRSPLS